MLQPNNCRYAVIETNSDLRSKILFIETKIVKDCSWVSKLYTMLHWAKFISVFKLNLEIWKYKLLNLNLIHVWKAGCSNYIQDRFRCRTNTVAEHNLLAHTFKTYVKCHEILATQLFRQWLNTLLPKMPDSRS